MAPDRTAADLSREVPLWVRDGIITQEQGTKILRRYPERRGGPEEPGWVIQLLYATAGVLLGAAVIALLVAGLKIEDAPPFLIASGALMAVALLVHLGLGPKRQLAADAIYAAGLVPLSLATFQQDYAGFTAMGVALALLVWRRQRAFLQGLASLAFSVAAFGTFFEFFVEVDTLGWASAQLGLLAVVVVLDLVARGHSNMAGFVAVAAFAISTGTYLGDDIVSSSEVAELILMGIMLVVGLGGFLLRHRGILMGASTALSVTAIVFAFDVGGWVFGVVALLAVAGILIWQAETLRRYFRAVP